MAAMTTKATKKRSALTQSGPTSKKIHLEPSKRRQPVVETSEESDFEEGDEGFVEDEMEVDEETSIERAAKDPLAVRQAHRAQKIVQQERRAAKPHSSVLTDAKRIWALARQQNIPPVERQKHVHDLMDVIRGKVQDIVFKHDASRIVQTIVKHGKQKERDEIAVELKGKYKELACNKYSKFLVTKLIKHCPTHRAAILLEFQSHVLRLLLHREASTVLADAFETYATAYERTILLRDLYGKEANMFGVTSGSDEDKERARKGLAGLLEGSDKERRRRILDATKSGLISIFNNPEKAAMKHAIVHRVLWEYIVAVNENPNDEEREKQLREIYEACLDLLMELVHTKDGSRSVREFIARGSAKDRKQILKTFKDNVIKMCQQEEAQLVLFTAIDVIDDTKLVLKTILPEIIQALDELYVTTNGRRALLYLIVPRTKRHFTPAQIVGIAEADELRAKTSKKDKDARESEIRVGASEALLSWVAQKGDSIAREPAGSLLLTEIMLFCDGDKAKASEALLLPFDGPYPSEDKGAPHAVDLSHASRMYKSLLQGGHYNRATSTIDKAPRWDATAFATAFITTAGQNGVVNMCTKGERNGAFVVAEALVACDEKTRKDAKKWFSSAIMKDIEESDMKGKAVLLERLR